MKYSSGGDYVILVPLNELLAGLFGMWVVLSLSLLERGALHQLNKRFL